MLEQIVLVQTLSKYAVVACSTSSARTQKNRADRMCQCWVLRLRRYMQQLDMN